jgi:hypothetical protein
VDVVNGTGPMAMEEATGSGTSPLVRQEADWDSRG